MISEGRGGSEGGEWSTVMDRMDKREREWTYYHYDRFSSHIYCICCIFKALLLVIYIDCDSYEMGEHMGIDIRIMHDRQRNKGTFLCSQQNSEMEGQIFVALR